MATEIVTIAVPVDLKHVRQAAGILPPQKAAERFVEVIDDAVDKAPLTRLLDMGAPCLGITYIPEIGLLFFFQIIK